MNEAKLGSYSVCCVLSDVCMCECVVHKWVANSYVTLCWNYGDTINMEQYKLVFITLKVNMWGTWRAPAILLVLRWFNNIHHWWKHTGMSNLLTIQVCPTYWPYHFGMYKIPVLIAEMEGRNGRKYRKKLKDSDFITKIMTNIYQIRLKTWEHIWTHDYLWQYTAICIEKWQEHIWTLLHLWYYHHLHHHYLHRGERQTFLLFRFWITNGLGNLIIFSFGM